jgi:hypothetical protein
MSEAGFTIPLGPVIPVLASVVALWILVSATTQQLIAGGAALLAGAVLYLIATAGDGRATEARKHGGNSSS